LLLATTEKMANGKNMIISHAARKMGEKREKIAMQKHIFSILPGPKTPNPSTLPKKIKTLNTWHINLAPGKGGWRICGGVAGSTGKQGANGNL